MPSNLPETDDQIACEMTGHRHPWAYEEGEHGVTCTHCLAAVPEEYLATAYYSGKRRVATAKAVKSRIIDIGIMIATKTGVVTDPEVVKALHARADKDHITSAEVILQQHWCATGGHPFLWEQAEAPLRDGTEVYNCMGCNAEIARSLLEAQPPVAVTALDADGGAHPLLGDLDRLHAAQQPIRIVPDAPPALIKPNPDARIGGRHVDQVIVDDPLLDHRTPTEREADEQYFTAAPVASETEADQQAAAQREDQMIIDDQAFVDDPLAVAMAETRPALAKRLQDARDHGGTQQAPDQREDRARWEQAIEEAQASEARVFDSEWANTPTHPSSLEEAERLRRDIRAASKVTAEDGVGMVLSPQVQAMIDDDGSAGSMMLADNAADAQAAQDTLNAAEGARDPLSDPRSEQALDHYKAMREDYIQTGRRLPPDDLVIRIVQDLRKIGARLDDLELSGSLADGVRKGAMDRLGETIRMANGLLPSWKHA